MTTRRDRSYLGIATSLRRGYKQKTNSNDWMSHRKPLIFTQYSSSSPFERFYNSAGRSARSEQAPMSVDSVYLIYSYHPKHMIGFSDIQFFSVEFLLKQRIKIFSHWNFFVLNWLTVLTQLSDTSFDLTYFWLFNGFPLKGCYEIVLIVMLREFVST